MHIFNCYFEILIVQQKTIHLVILKPQHYNKFSEE
jgi:hypothetical protein